MISTPYFLQNKDWFEIKIVDGKPIFRLTDKAPKEAIDSYNNFCKQIKGGISLN